MQKIKWSTALALVAILALIVPTSAAAPAFPDLIILPTGFRPEGIVVGQSGTFYTGSLVGGAIYRGSLVTGKGSVFIPGQPGMVSVGMDYDVRSKYLFVAGGPTGLARVFDTRDGSLAAAYQLAAPGFFINDVIVTRTAAYFTNSSQPVLYRLPLGANGSLPGAGAVEEIALSGDWQQVAGFNANGIVADQFGKHLIVVNSTVGSLYLVDPASGVARMIDLGGESVSAGDGLLLRGQTLYVMRNQLNEIAVIELARDLASGVVVDRLTDPDFNVPTTIADFANSIYAVNAKFGNLTPNDIPYEVVRLPLK